MWGPQSPLGWQPGQRRGRSGQRRAGVVAAVVAWAAAAAHSERAIFGIATVADVNHHVQVAICTQPEKTSSNSWPASQNDVVSNVVTVFLYCKVDSATPAAENPADDGVVGGEFGGGGCDGDESGDATGCDGGRFPQNDVVKNGVLLFEECNVDSAMPAAEKPAEHRGSAACP